MNRGVKMIINPKKILEEIKEKGKSAKDVVTEKRREITQ